MLGLLNSYNLSIYIFLAAEVLKGIGSDLLKQIIVVVATREYRLT